MQKHFPEEKIINQEEEKEMEGWNIKNLTEINRNKNH